MQTATASAQNAALAGRVLRAGSNAPIAGAEVVLLPRGTRAVTDAKGEFRFDASPSGYVMIHVRRIGFAPDSLGVQLPLSAPIDVQLRETVQKLDTVSVSARENVLPRGKLAGFYERKKFGIGRFIESDIFEKEQYRQLGDVITSRAAGTRLVRARLGSTVWIATALQAGTSTAALDPTDRLKGADPRACYPDVWLDGVNVYSYGRGMPLFDVNLIGTNNVSAVEVYVGASQTPSQYAKTGAICGVVLVWTK